MSLAIRVRQSPSLGEVLFSRSQELLTCIAGYLLGFLFAGRHEGCLSNGMDFCDG